MCGTVKIVMESPAAKVMTDWLASVVGTEGGSTSTDIPKTGRDRIGMTDELAMEVPALDENSGTVLFVPRLDG